MALIGRHTGQEIQTDGMLQVRRIEVNQIVGAPGRNVVQEFIGQIAVRIDEPDPVTGGDLLDDQIAEQCAFADTGFAKGVKVLPLAGCVEAKQLFSAPS